MDFSQPRNTGRQHKFLELQHQICGDLGIGGIESVADAEAERVIGTRITIRPVGSLSVKADGVDVEKFISAGGAGVVTEHHPTIDIKLKVK